MQRTRRCCADFGPMDIRKETIMTPTKGLAWGALCVLLLILLIGIWIVECHPFRGIIPS